MEHQPSTDMKRAPALYEIAGLSFAYPAAARPALDDVSLTIPAGQFITLCGASGCGKTTLLRQLKPMLAPHGQKTGKILFQGTDLQQLPQRQQSAAIGFVQQNPDNQIVTDKVWHELAFGLESLGFATATIRLRVAEMASFFGIQNWFHKDVAELSGGQKQLLNLASIMAMHPSMLILDEPTSQLDPIAAADFLATVGRINRELGTTILLTEHRLEEVLPLSQRMLVMEQGKIIADGAPSAAGQQLGREHHKMFLAMPTPMRVYAATPSQARCPVTVSEGRLWLDDYAKEQALQAVEKQPLPGPEGPPILELEEAWFRYQKDAPDVLRGASLQVRRGEFLAVLGGNGTGKSTALAVLSGLRQPYRGQVKMAGQPLHTLRGQAEFAGWIAALPQNPQVLFVKKTVQLDLYEMFQGRAIDRQEQERRVSRVAKLCQLEGLLTRHPYDLSGGEQQRAALAKVLLLEPKILLLDEPTKGLDAEFKQVFAAILKGLQAEGVAILMVSHDMEFCAGAADRCALFFDGHVVSNAPPTEFFSGNSFYTTAANRMARHLLPQVVTTEELIAACGGQLPSAPQVEPASLAPAPLPEKSGDGVPPAASAPAAVQAAPAPQGRSKPQLVVGLLALALFAATLIWSFPSLKLLALALQGGALAAESSAAAWQYLGILVLLASFGAVALVALFGKRPQPGALLPEQKTPRKLPKRTLVATAMILVLIPLTLFVGHHFFGDRKYYFISMLIIIECILPFLMIYEGRKPQARELIVIAVLCAIAIAGRAAFFMLPQFKPVIAIVIISAVAFGGETGFLVGALSALVSNFFFGQGPWAPWQMFAMGMIGFLAGLLFRKGLLRQSRVALAVFGGLATFFIYGGLLNPASVLMYQANPTWEMFALAYLRGLPFDLIHAAATVFFLLVLSRPMLEKLERIKLKYGLLE